MRLLASLCLFLLLFLTIPITAQTTAPSSGPGWVVLPVNDYIALKHAASKTEPPEAPPPPVEATLSRIDYELKIDGDLASGEARLTVDVIKNGWVRVPMPEGLMVRDAQLDGHPVNLITEAGAQGPGRPAQQPGRQQAGGRERPQRVGQVAERVLLAARHGGLLMCEAGDRTTVGGLWLSASQVTH